MARRADAGAMGRNKAADIHKFPHIVNSQGILLKMKCIYNVNLDHVSDL